MLVVIICFADVNMLVGSRWERKSQPFFYIETKFAIVNFSLFVVAHSQLFFRTLQFGETKTTLRLKAMYSIFIFTVYTILMPGIVRPLKKARSYLLYTSFDFNLIFSCYGYILQNSTTLSI